MSTTNPNNKVIYKDLNETFGKYTYQDFYIIVHKESGYINGNKTSICYEKQEKI